MTPSPGTNASDLGTFWTLLLRAEALDEELALATTDAAQPHRHDHFAASHAYPQSLIDACSLAEDDLRPANEELPAMNDALQSRIADSSQANADLLNVLDAVDVPFLILDLEQRIQRFTPRAGEIFNVLSSDVGRRLTDLNLDIDVPDLRQRIAEVIATASVKELEVQDQGGRWHRMQMRPHTTTDDEIAGAVVYLVDIDALKRQLDVERQARAEAERANLAKDQFLATLSHELRNQLSTTLMHAQMLDQGYLDEGAIQRTAQAIERSTQHQARLIDDLLDVTRIDAHKLHTRTLRVDLRSVVQASLEAAAEAANRKRVELCPLLADGACTVEGDPTRLQQVVTNLLSNAIKFTPEGGRVSVMVEVTSDQVTLRVTDTGGGISPEFLPHVFDRFAQEASSRALATGGLGLGLSIVRHLVELHGGRVHATSDGLGKGATFGVTLPLLSDSEEQNDRREPHDCMRPTIPVPKPSLKGLRVLVVDDDEGTCHAVAEMLRHAGAQVLAAKSAREAWEEFADFRPEVVLCDLMMPVEDGFHLLGRIRALGPQRGGDIPAIALSALTGNEDAARALTAGFQLHLSKPVELQRLAAAVVSLRTDAKPSY